MTPNSKPRMDLIGPAQADSVPIPSWRKRVTFQPVMIVVLAIVWVLLWGELSVANAVAGLILGSIVTVLFPISALGNKIRIRPIPFIWLIIKLLIDLVWSSAVVAATVLQVKRTPVNAIIAVRLRTPSDAYLVITSELLSLVPGTLVIEVHRTTHTIYLHVMDIRRPHELERARSRVLEEELRVVRAFGTKEEVRALTQQGGSRR